MQEDKTEVYVTMKAVNKLDIQLLFTKTCHKRTEEVSSTRRQKTGRRNFFFTHWVVQDFFARETWIMFLEMYIKITKQECTFVISNKTILSAERNDKNG